MDLNVPRKLKDTVQVNWVCERVDDEQSGYSTREETEGLSLLESD